MRQTISEGVYDENYDDGRHLAEEKRRLGFQHEALMGGLGVTTDKDVVLAPEEVIKAKEALSRIEKNLFYRLGRYLGRKLGSQPIK